MSDESINTRSGLMKMRELTDNRGAWTYHQSPLEILSEFGTVHGREVALPSHFHEEDQWIYVLRGQRRFVIGNESHKVKEGEWFCIPAGTVHRSLSEENDVLCINLYLGAGLYVPADVERYLQNVCLPALHMNYPIKTLDPGLALPISLAAVAHPRFALDSVGSVKDLARDAGMSREHFSRTFRRKHGAAPENYRLLLRANRARQFLKKGIPIATAASEAGFADQSHLGRIFKRLFGVTPGRYRQG